LSTPGRRAVDVAAIEVDEHTLADVGRRLGDQALEVDEAVLVGQRELVGGQKRHRVLPGGGQDLLHGGERAHGNRRQGAHAW
jgi:hypothetical protein